MSGTRKLDRPIILIGAPRSGTTFLGHIIRAHPDVAYWVEPRPVWMHGNAYHASDELGPKHATPRIARYIDKSFERFRHQRGGSRFAEKTPSNCLRLPFVHAVFPDCRIVNIVRDGRAVVRAMLDIQAKPPNKGLVFKRLKETPWRDWPANFGLYFRTFWRTKVLKKPSTYWGPRPAQWRDWIGLPRHVIAAKQWNALVGMSRRDGADLPVENYLEFRFEHMINDPAETVGRFLDFLDLEHAPEVMAFAEESADPSRSARRQAPLADDQEQEMLVEMRNLLDELGYLDEG